MTRAGLVLRETRLAQGVGLRELARTVGVSAGAMSREETVGGTIGEEILARWAQALGLDPDAVLALDGRISSAVRAYLQRHPEVGSALARLAQVEGRALVPRTSTGGSR